MQQEKLLEFLNCQGLLEVPSFQISYAIPIVFIPSIDYLPLIQIKISHRATLMLQRLSRNKHFSFSPSKINNKNEKNSTGFGISA